MAARSSDIGACWPGGGSGSVPCALDTTPRHDLMTLGWRELLNDRSNVIDPQPLAPGILAFVDKVAEESPRGQLSVEFENGPAELLPQIYEPLAKSPCRACCVVEGLLGVAPEVVRRVSERRIEE